ncbi:ARF/SAR superfamily [Daldinia grandis]|nr:ARF/SAR superfamily [Daldinia grandis]
MEFPNWIRSALISLGFLDKKAKLLLLGLDNSGKSTLLYRLLTDHLGVLEPTLHPTSEELRIENTVCTTFDLGGHQQARRLWKNYIPEVTGIIFVVDATDPERFAEAKAELWALLAMEELASVTFLVLGNKIDHPNAASDTELRFQLGLDDLLRDNVGFFMCSIAQKQGYGEGLRWLAQCI